MNEQPMMTCDWCAKEFPADARACVESGFSAVHPAEEGEEWKGEYAVALDPDRVSPEQREYLKTEMGINDAQLDELLTTGVVEGMGSIICVECQDEAAAGQNS